MCPNLKDYNVNAYVGIVGPQRLHGQKHFSWPVEVIMTDESTPKPKNGVFGSL